MKTKWWGSAARLWACCQPVHMPVSGEGVCGRKVGRDPGGRYTEMRTGMGGTGDIGRECAMAMPALGDFSDGSCWACLWSRSPGVVVPPAVWLILVGSALLPCSQMPRSQLFGSLGGVKRRQFLWEVPPGAGDTDCSLCPSFPREGAPSSWRGPLWHRAVLALGMR